MRGSNYFARVDGQDLAGREITENDISENPSAGVVDMREHQDPIPRRHARLARALQVGAMSETRRTFGVKVLLSDCLVALAKELVSFPDRLVALAQIGITFGAQNADPRLSFLQLKSKLPGSRHSANKRPRLCRPPEL
jgi:hypothetical protein